VELKLQAQSPVPVVYEGVRLDCGFRADVIVEDAVILEIKAVEQLAAIHLAQMIRISACPATRLVSSSTSTRRS
jgi:GxxExxY protein